MSKEGTGDDWRRACLPAMGRWGWEPGPLGLGCWSGQCWWVWGQALGLGGIRMRELVDSLHFLGVSVGWVLER